MRNKGTQRRPIYEQPKAANPSGDEQKYTKDTEELSGLAKLHHTISAFLAEHDARAKREEARYPAKDRRERNTVRAIIAYTAITGALLAAGAYQAYVAHQTEVASNRAWLEPENFSFGNFTQGERIRITAQTENVGKEPALGPTFVMPDAGVMAIAPEACCNNMLVKIPAGDMCAGVIPRPGNVIFPGQKYPYERYVRPESPAYPTAKDFQTIAAGAAVFYWRDCVIYETFKERHSSSFCFYLMKSPTTGDMQTIHCAVGNDAN